MKIFVDIELGGLLAPSDLPGLIGEVEKALTTAGFDPRGGGEVITVSGRLPIWAATAVIHAVGHARPAAAVFDPRIQAGVVVMSHTPTYKVGDLVPVEGTRIVVKFGN